MSGLLDRVIKQLWLEARKLSTETPRSLLFACSDAILLTSGWVFMRIMRLEAISVVHNPVGTDNRSLSGFFYGKTGAGRVFSTFFIFFKISWGIFNQKIALLYGGTCDQGMVFFGR